MSTYNAVEDHLTRFEAIDAQDGPAAIAHAFAAIGAINQQIAPPATTNDLMATSALLGGDLVEKLQAWIERLLNKLREVVKQLADVLTFSLSIGTTVSLTIEFVGTNSGTSSS